MGKEYEGTDRVEDFFEAHERLLPEICRVTAPGGSICWQVGYHVKNSEITPLDYLVHSIMGQIPEMVLRNRIIWTYGHGLHCANRFSGRHEMILWYSKGKNSVFNLNAVRVPQKYPGKRHYKGPRKGKYSGNPLGKNPSDVWEIPNVKANHVEKTAHPCQFPVALALRLVKALTRKGDSVLDPFMGSGTTGVAAILEGRSFFGAEIMRRYHTIANRRCQDAAAGKVRFRPPELSIYVPDPASAVARRPKRANLARK
jgi:adenine-specific DNA-methyltransferase